MSIREGSEIFDQHEEKYIVDEFINRGAFGDVFKISNKNTGETRALKTIYIGFAKEDEVLALQNEGELAPQINHKNVNRIHYFHDGNQYPNLPPYMIMDYADSGTLNDILQMQRSNGKFFDVEMLTELLIQLAEGMEALNDKLVHRDLKPDNILVHQGILKISDFGLSKIEGAATRDRTFKGIQHIHYKAPEAWVLDTNTKKMDIYSMGIVFFELATLKHPYEVKTKIDPFEAWKEAHLYTPIPLANTINSGLPKNIVEVIKNMVQKRPEDRYDDWSQIIKRLKAETDMDSQNKGIDITTLIHRSHQTQQKQIEKDLELQRKESKSTNKRKLIGHRFQEIKEALSSLAENFNNHSDSVNIKVEDTGDKVHVSVPNNEYTQNSPSQRFFSPKQVNQVVASYFIAPNDLKLRNKEVLAWGYIISSDETGFNILLVKENEEDIYGRWVTFHNEVSPLVRNAEGKKAPFAITEESEFIRKVNVIGALDSIQTREGIFSADQLVPLFESIL
ncbi:serine/threonine-protein kinase [Priestia aryabhattai]|uniref:serine/threonine-protein kinase n=1 Tax=Priestia aryabhattai TaxID=412384 RepID=UPI001C8E33B3|nr:serine/threonine-protein kinase [Priestia aryabhattai]MBY0062363.1 serine/threonine protein kinase [Priestia aryabhattai]